MKQLLAVLIVLLPLLVKSQLQSGGTHAGFTIDGDTKVGYSKYGPATSTIINDDDWYLTLPYSGAGKNVIDTSNASYYRSVLQAGGNIAFTKGMAVPKYSVMNNRIWLDAVYQRDYICNSKDSSCFSIACKNTDNPNSSWFGGTSSFTSKTDLIDAFAHFRRNGINISDSLWFYTALTTLGTSGSRYFDVELYKLGVGYNSSTGAFSTAGTAAGHSQWTFDASGNVTSTGDMIIAVTFSPGSAPVIDLRIWVSQTVYNTVIPVNFKFGANFDLSPSGTYGYAQIISNAGGTAWGSGMSNYSGVASSDTTYSTPWGTHTLVGGVPSWAANYDQLQFVEIGLNFTRIGLDPYLYSSSGVNPCGATFSSILFKSRSSASFTSNLQDFTGPFDMTLGGFTNYSYTFDSLSCKKPTGTIAVIKNPAYAAGVYQWSTSNGSIVSTSSDGSQITVGAAGTYYLSSSMAVGCPVLRKDTIRIVKDDYQPVATAIVYTDSVASKLYLYGGDEALSNYMTPFGGSQGLTWYWTGPNGFSSTLQNPVVDTVWGNYCLIVTEKRNGCKDTACTDITLKLLASEGIELSGNVWNDIYSLNWNSSLSANAYRVERSVNGTNFELIASVSNSLSSSQQHYEDRSATGGVYYYRIAAINNNGLLVHSNMIRLNKQVNTNEIKVWNAAGQPLLRLSGKKPLKGDLKMMICSANGQVLLQKQYRLNDQLPADNIIIPAMPHSTCFVLVYFNNQLSLSKKMFF